MERQGPGLCCGREREKTKNEPWEGDQTGCREAGIDVTRACIFVCVAWLHVEAEEARLPAETCSEPSSCVISRKLGSGKFLLLWACLIVIPCFYVRAGGPGLPTEIQGLFFCPLMYVIKPLMPNVDSGPFLCPHINRVWKEEKECLKSL